MSSSNKKLLFVYNPKAGKAKIKSNLLDIIDVLVKAGYEVTAYPTQCPGDATNAVINRHDYYNLVVCSGGDGTLDEVVYGMMRSTKKVPIGYIPAGSTNDFARSIGIRGTMSKTAGIIADPKLYPCDIGRLNDAFFVYIAAFGVFTEVTYDTEQRIKNTIGYSAYVIEAIKSIPSIQSYNLKVTYEGGVIEGEFIYGMITNSTSVGGFKGITGHHVEMNDGFFEVTLIKKPSSPIELNHTLVAMVDRRLDSDCIITFKTSKISIESDGAIAWNRDGEYGGHHKKVDIEVCPQAITMLVPKGEK